MKSYTNPWHNPKKPEYGPREYQTDAEPRQYRGFEIFHRGVALFDIVQGDACVGQYAGFNGATRAIDAYVDGTGVHYLRLQEPAAESGEQQDGPKSPGI